MRTLLILFILVPITEMWLLISVGGVIGAIPTIALVLLTACIGLALLRHQGAEALMSARAKLQANELPVREIADTLFFAIGGALLLTPGFITDAIGFACLTPGVRTLLIHFFAKHLLRSGSVRMGQFRSSSQAHSSANRDSNTVIEGEYSRGDKD